MSVQQFNPGDTCRTLRAHPIDGDNYPKGSIVTILQYVGHLNSYVVVGQSTKYCWVSDWLEPVQKQKKGFGKWYSRVIG